MATLAYITSLAVFALEGAVFMTVFLLVLHAVSAPLRHALRERRRRKEREIYENYLYNGKLE